MRDDDPRLERSQPEACLIGKRLRADEAPDREGDGLSVGVERPRGVRPARLRWVAKRSRGDPQRFDQCVAARLAELDVEPEEASLRAQGGDARSLIGIEPVQDFDHALADYGRLRTAQQRA